MFDSFNNYQFNYDMFKVPVTIKIKHDGAIGDDGLPTTKYETKYDECPIMNVQNPNNTSSNGSGGFLDSISLVMISKIKGIPRDSIVEHDGDSYHIMSSAKVTGTDIVYYQLKAVTNDE